MQSMIILILVCFDASSVLPSAKIAKNKKPAQRGLFDAFILAQGVLPKMSSVAKNAVTDR